MERRNNPDLTFATDKADSSILFADKESDKDIRYETLYSIFWRFRQWNIIGHFWPFEDRGILHNRLFIIFGSIFSAFCATPASLYAVVEARHRFQSGGHKCTSENYGIFFIKRFKLTTDPILIMLLKLLKQNSKFKSGYQPPRKSGGPMPMRIPLPPPLSLCIIKYKLFDAFRMRIVWFQRK